MPSPYNGLRPGMPFYHEIKVGRPLKEWKDDGSFDMEIALKQSRSSSPERTQALRPKGSKSLPGRQTLPKPGCGKVDREQQARSKSECRMVEDAVTTHEHHPVSTASSYITSPPSVNQSTPSGLSQIQGDDRAAQVGSSVPQDLNPSSEHTSVLLGQEIAVANSTVNSDLPNQVPNTATDTESGTSNTAVVINNDLDDCEMEDASGSDISVACGEEALNQLRAKNEDLRSESQYYRLMAEITMKTASLRRGYTRSPLAPSSLSPQLSGLHQVLMTEGLPLPNSVADRGRAVSNVIELHLTWESNNLKQSISPSAAVNSFVEFAALFTPQIQGLANTAFIGGEDTAAVRTEITTITLQLLCWIMEESANLAEYVTPQYFPHGLLGWYEAGVKALWDLDTCLAATCQQRLQCFPESQLPVANFNQPDGKYSRHIVDWGLAQLSWTNNVASRLHQQVGMVPNHAGVLVPLLDLTRQALKTYLRPARQQYRLARERRQLEQATLKKNRAEAEKAQQAERVEAERLEALRLGKEKAERARQARVNRELANLSYEYRPRGRK